MGGEALGRKVGQRTLRPGLAAFKAHCLRPGCRGLGAEGHKNDRAPSFPPRQRAPMVRTPRAFNILTTKCASRHNGVHFFEISTSKSGPELVFFVHFDLEMRFAPQRRALFRHRNFQKWSDPGVFCTF